MLHSLDKEDDWRYPERLRTMKEAAKEEAGVDWRYYVGIDLAKYQDRSVITTLRSERKRTIDPITGEEKDDVENVVRGIHILPKGLKYTEQIGFILAHHDRQPFNWWPTETYVDESGVGVPVCDALEQRRFKFKRVSITASGDPHIKNGRHLVSRNHLIGLVAKYVIGRENFFISSNLADAPKFKRELENLTYEVSKAGNMFVGEGQGDDITMSLALALYGLDKGSKLRTGTRPMFFG